MMDVLDLEHESSNREAPKLEGVKGFRGVSFEEWLRIFMQFDWYCFSLTARRQYEVADEVLQHVLISNAYFSTEY
uniref:Uncharacterized protein n=1 Tax=Moniliophthora roreri TaxID=221103 RepID=A0A0W0FUS2_MONRR